MAKPALSDEEKKRRGTYRADQSEAVYAARRAEKVIIGPWLATIPEPEMPLGPIGKAKYEELAGMLLDQNKLTAVTAMDCQMASLLWENIQAKIEANKRPSTDSIKQFSVITQRLKIAENAPAIANPNEKSRFEGAGFANRRSSPFRLRPLTAANQGKP